MTFGSALDLMKQGYKVSREGWNGKGMHVAVGGLDTEGSVKDFVYMVTVDGSIIPWLASQTDILAVDWVDKGRVGYLVWKN